MNPCRPEVAMGAYRRGIAPPVVRAGRSRAAGFRGCPPPPETPPSRYTVVGIQ